ncbi:MULTISPECIES: replication initiator [Protofrankia]|uniref:Putative plasmid replication initiator protein n=1 Tax=Candidatus Protofrankia datiscae TaxID=2716812 RepID=F8B4F8_9ACTN|nr:MULTISPECIES: replication initiator [Protofrankia]AEH07899.1 putative plasmid replication initiator protein [Candidatus Protofrankia datiscae]
MSVLDSEYFRALAPRVVDGSASGFLAQLDRVAGCAHPVRLTGTIDQVDTATGETRRTFDTTGMPDGVILVPCGNRRASVCPSCSYLYAGDAWQIVHAGMVGGAGVPESVTAHPGLFVTVTAPSFGPVHSRRSNHGPAQVCRPRRGRCPHGIAAGCHRVHPDDDPLLGQALCPDCHDDPALILWNRAAGRLWKRTVDLTYRRMARTEGIPERACRQAVRISYVKVAEGQARGAVHFHALLRLDDATTPDGTWAPPPVWATGKLLAACWRWAVTHAEQPCPNPRTYDLPSLTDALAVLADGGLLDIDQRPPTTPSLPAMTVARWGEQADVRHVRVEGGELTPLAVGNYLAKYITKSVVDTGTLDRRFRDTDDVHARTPFLTPHHARLAHTAWRLGRIPELAEYGLRKWAHQFGYNGHWLTKSRRYSTTFTARRITRRIWARTHTPTCEERIPVDAWGRPEDDDLTVAMTNWRYQGSGYKTPSDAWLALQAADQARSRREENRRVPLAA